MEKFNLKDDNMSESSLPKVDDYHMYPRDFIINTDKRFADIDNDSMGGTRWTCFYTKVNQSIYFDSFGSYLEIFLMHQLPKPIIFHE